MEESSPKKRYLRFRLQQAEQNSAEIRHCGHPSTIGIHQKFRPGANDVFCTLLSRLISTNGHYVQSGTTAVTLQRLRTFTNALCHSAQLLSAVWTDAIITRSFIQTPPPLRKYCSVLFYKASHPPTPRVQN